MAVPLIDGPLSAPSTQACTYRPCAPAYSTPTVRVYLDAMVCGIAQLYGVVGKHFDFGREGKLGEDAEGEFGLSAALRLTIGGYSEFTFLPTLSPPFSFFLSFLDGCCRSGLHVRNTSHPTTNTHI
jgi:hypothetical protein